MDQNLHLNKQQKCVSIGASRIKGEEIKIKKKIQARTPHVPYLPNKNVPTNNKSNFDVGEWASRVKIPVPLTKFMKMYDQKQKFLQAINVPLPRKVEVPKNNTKNMEK